MEGKSNGSTDFIDTLIEAYNSMEEVEKEKLNEIAMSIYNDINRGKADRPVEQPQSTPTQSIPSEGSGNTGSKISAVNIEVAAAPTTAPTAVEKMTTDNKEKLSGIFNSLKALSGIK